MAYDPYITMISALAGVAVLGLAWYIGRVSMQITYVTLADGRRQERRLPLLFRLLLPFAPNFRILFSAKWFEARREKIRRNIVAAGYSGLIEAGEMQALRVLTPLVAGTAGCLLLYAAMLRMPGRIGLLLLDRQFLLYALILLVAAWYPGLWLQRVLKARHLEMERALPFVLDLLTLSVEAGVDFMTGIRRIIERRTMDALGEELVRVFRQIQIGKTRKEALRDLADRAHHPDIYSVTNALIQADELGTSIGAALRIQSDQMRTRRYQRAEKLANEAPVKILFPLIAFIFPAVFIVLMGPILLQLLRQGF